MDVNFSFTINKTNENETTDRSANPTQRSFVFGLIFLFKTMKINEPRSEANPRKYKAIFNGFPPLVTEDNIKIENNKLEKNKMPAAQNGANASRCDFLIARK